VQPSHDLPIILFPGMGADERLFSSQMAAFPNIVIPKWIPPRKYESLRDYAARLAPFIDPKKPCLVGGASFGGMVAMELATHFPNLGCILIGSIRSPSSLSWRWKRLRPFAVLGPDFLRFTSWAASRFGKRFLSQRALRVHERLAGPNFEFVRWAMCAAVCWRPSSATKKLRVFHIHGEKDHILPVNLVQPDVIVPGGEHALSLFRPSTVNDFLANVIQTVTGK